MVQNMEAFKDTLVSMSVDDITVIKQWEDGRLDKGMCCRVNTKTLQIKVNILFIV